MLQVSKKEMERSEKEGAAKLKGAVRAQGLALKLQAAEEKARDAALEIQLPQLLCAARDISSASTALTTTWRAMCSRPLR